MVAFYERKEGRNKGHLKEFFSFRETYNVAKHLNFERKEGTENCWDEEKNHTLCELCRKLISALNVFVINSAAVEVDGSLGWILPNKFCCGKKALENNMCI